MVNSKEKGVYVDEVTKDAMNKEPQVHQMWQVVEARLENLKKFHALPWYDDAPRLWAFASEYFKWADDNKIYKAVIMKSGENAGEVYYEPYPRPYTLDDFCLFCGFDKADFRDINQESTGYNEVIYIMKCIAAIIRGQKFNHALIGTYNFALIQKELGLTGTDEPTDAPAQIVVEVIKNRDRLATDESEITDCDIVDVIPENMKTTSKKMRSSDEEEL